MEPRPARSHVELTALAIAPDRALAQQFSHAIQPSKLFHVLAELKSYPPAQTLDIRLRQLRPDLVFLDLATDLDRACELIPFVTSFRPAIHVVGLHTGNEPEAILRSMRAGATEFLHAPFDLETQREAAARLCRMQPECSAEPQRGKLVVFASAKPGSGASTLASQTAFALRKLTGERILLADLDLWSGTLGFFFKLGQRPGWWDSARQPDWMEPSHWDTFVTSLEGVDILPAPETPLGRGAEQERLPEMLEFARTLYDWILLDLPPIFDRLTLLALSDSDHAFLVTTPELPSLHLTRKAVAFLGQLGFGQDRFRVLVNRVSKRDGITGEQMAKVFNAPVHGSFPNDYASLHQVLSAGQPLGTGCALGRTIQDFARVLSGKPAAAKRRAGFPFGARAAAPETSGNQLWQS